MLIPAFGRAIFSGRAWLFDKFLATDNANSLTKFAFIRAIYLPGPECLKFLAAGFANLLNCRFAYH